MSTAKFLSTVTHRGVSADHYIENGKYMIWYHKPGKYGYKDTIGMVQVRGLKKPLAETDLQKHIDKLWEEYYNNAASNNDIAQEDIEWQS